jgi:hypothetical protein
MGMGNAENRVYTSEDMYKKLYDKSIISDLRIKYEDKEKIIFGVKRSHFKITIPKQVNPEIAYLAGIIAGDGNFYCCRFDDRIYPRIRLRITSGDIAQLDMLNESFIKTFGAGGRIHKHRGKNCYDLHNNHRLIWLYFRNILGLDKRKLIVPEQIANPELFRFFLAGFFDTDGYCSKGAFGTMIGAKNLPFLCQLVSYSAEFYSLRFSPVKVNILVTKDKTFKRAYTRLTKYDSEKFRQIIPIRKKKYGPTQDRTGDLRCSSNLMDFLMKLFSIKFL